MSTKEFFFFWTHVSIIKICFPTYYWHVMGTTKYYYNLVQYFKNQTWGRTDIATGSKVNWLDRINCHRFWTIFYRFHGLSISFFRPDRYCDWFPVKPASLVQFLQHWFNLFEFIIIRLITKSIVGNLLFSYWCWSIS
jgi:hypothetical protein